jgi:hypothetical protein
VITHGLSEGSGAARESCFGYRPVSSFTQGHQGFIGLDFEEVEAGLVILRHCR